MILGVGTDIVQVSRFNHWQRFSAQKLARIFTPQELQDCYDVTAQGYVAEKLAARFAAKEAFFKALSAMLVGLGLTHKPFSLMALCPQVQIEKTTWDVPQLKVNWDFFNELLGRSLPSVSVAVSFSHERDYAVGFVVISQ